MRLRIRQNFWPIVQFVILTQQKRVFVVLLMSKQGLILVGHERRRKIENLLEPRKTHVETVDFLAFAVNCKEKNMEDLCSGISYEYALVCIEEFLFAEPNIDSINKLKSRFLDEVNGPYSMSIEEYNMHYEYQPSYNKRISDIIATRQEIAEERRIAANVDAQEELKAKKECVEEKNASKINEIEQLFETLGLVSKTAKQGFTRY